MKKVQSRIPILNKLVAKIPFVKIQNYKIEKIKCEKGEKPDSHPDLVAKIQPGVVGLGHDSRDNSGTHRHTTGFTFETKSPKPAILLFLVLFFGDV